MKKGQFLCIPYPAATTVQPTQKEDPYAIPPSNSELFRKSKETPQKLSTIKAALLLPFQEDRRMVEYYEGFLMAVDSLKRTGISLDLYVYDCGKDLSTLNTILAKNEMKSMNIIFGPMHQNQIKPLSDFAEKNDIRLVIPFSQKEKRYSTIRQFIRSTHLNLTYIQRFMNTSPVNFPMQTLSS